MIHRTLEYCFNNLHNRYMDNWYQRKYHYYQQCKSWQQSCYHHCSPDCHRFLLNDNNELKIELLLHAILTGAINDILFTESDKITICQ